MVLPPSLIPQWAWAVSYWPKIPSEYVPRHLKSTPTLTATSASITGQYHHKHPFYERWALLKEMKTQ